MDARKLKVAPTTALHIKDAGGELLYDDGQPVRIVIYGPGSKQAGIVEARSTARLTKRMAENDNRVTPPTAEERRAEMVEDLTTMTVAFEHLSYDDLAGTELFAAVYGDPELGYIANQVTKATGDWGKYKLGSATA